MKRLLFITILAGLILSANSAKAGVFTMESCTNVFGESPEVCTDFPKTPKPLVYPQNLAEPFANGYHQFPEPQNGEYELPSSVSQVRRCGSRELIGVLYTAILQFNELYPDSRIWIGELNAGGHIEHKYGVTADIGGWGNREEAVVFGKALVETGYVQKIIYRVKSVNAEINEYAQEIGMDSPMRYKSDHWHFHIQIEQELGGSISSSCGS